MMNIYDCIFKFIILDFENRDYLKEIEESQKEKTIKIAKDMLKDNVNILNISKYTSLTVEEIGPLR